METDAAAMHLTGPILPYLPQPGQSLNCDPRYSPGRRLGMVPLPGVRSGMGSPEVQAPPSGANMQPQQTHLGPQQTVGHRMEGQIDGIGPQGRMGPPLVLAASVRVNIPPPPAVAPIPQVQQHTIPPPPIMQHRVVPPAPVQQHFIPPAPVPQQHLLLPAPVQQHILPPPRVQQQQQAFPTLQMINQLNPYSIPNVASHPAPPPAPPHRLLPMGGSVFAGPTLEPQVAPMIFAGGDDFDWGAWNTATASISMDFERDFGAWFNPDPGEPSGSSG